MQKAWLTWVSRRARLEEVPPVWAHADVRVAQKPFLPMFYAGDRPLEPGPEVVDLFARLRVYHRPLVRDDERSAWAEAHLLASDSGIGPKGTLLLT